MQYDQFDGKTFMILHMLKALDHFLRRKSL